MTQPHVEVGFGKLRPGQVLRVDPDRADRWMVAGIAEASSEGAYNKFREARAQGIEDRQGAFSALNRDDKAALWDVSTHRDVLTAPEDGLRRAMEAGVPLVNMGSLRTEDGLPLAADASIEQILEARAALHPGVMSPLTEHEMASTSGGGSHYDMPLPLNPAARDTERTIRENERNRQSDTFLKENQPARGSARAAAAARRSETAAAQAQQAEKRD
jgi:hypothetical protein